MAIDDSKLAYSSEWEIDKISDYQDATTNPALFTEVLAGFIKTLTVPNPYGYKPYITAQYKPAGQGTWFEAGENLQFSTSQLLTMSVWVGETEIYFELSNGHVTNQLVNIRYWVAADGN